MADETLRFDIIGRDDASGAFSRVGRAVGDMSANMNIATRSALVLDEALKRQLAAARASADATLAHARADKILADAEHVLAKGALEAEFALKKEAAAAKASGDAAKKAAADKKAAAQNQGWLAKSAAALPLAAIGGWGAAGVAAGASGVLGIVPALAAAGAGLASFGALAIPTITSLQAGMATLSTATSSYAAASANLNTAIHQSPADMKLYQATLANLDPSLRQAAGLLTNQNVIWQNLSPSMQASVVALANNKAAIRGLLPSQNLALTALMKQKTAWDALTPGQQTASVSIGKLSASFSNMVTALEPLTLRVLNDGLAVANKLLPIMLPFANSAGSALDGLLKKLSKFVTPAAVIPLTGPQPGPMGSKLTALANETAPPLQKTGFQLFVEQMQKLSGPTITAIGEGIGKIAVAVGKLLLAMQSPDALRVLNGLFSVLGGLITGVAGVFTILTPAVSGFFRWLSNVPPGIVKPLEDTAAALLIMKGLGVFSVGIKLAGVAAGWVKRLLGGAEVDVAAGAMQKAADTQLAASLNMLKASGLSPAGAAAGGTAAGGKFAGAAAALGPVGAGLAIGAVLRAGGDTISPKGSTAGAISKGLQTSSFAGIPGMNLVSGYIAWVSVRWTELAHATAHTFDTIRHWISGAWDLMFADARAKVTSIGHDVTSRFDGLRHDVAVRFDGLRHDVALYWDLTWRNTTGRAQRGVHDVAVWFDIQRHDTAVRLDGLRHDAAHYWDLTWNDTVGRVSRGTGDVIRWIGSLPGRISGVFRDARKWLYGAGKDVIQGLWDGLTFIWGKVTSWISSIAGWIVAHKGPLALDRHLLEPAGRALMEGLHTGLTGGFGKISSFITGIGAQVAGAVGAAFAGGGSAISWLQAAMAATGAPQSWLPGLETIMMAESGGNPQAYNPTSVGGEHATGLMQMLPSTYAAFATMAGGILNPVSNAAAAIRYIMSRYVSPYNIPGLGTSRYVGYDTGYGVLPPGLSLSWNGTGRPEPLMPARGGGATYIINVSPTPLARPADIGREVVGAIREHEKRSGKGWRS